MTFAEKDHWFEGLVEVEEMEHSLLLQMEEQVLGVAVSGNVADPYRAIIRMHGHNTSQDIKEEEEKKFFTVCGVLTDVRLHAVKSGKSKGQMMAFAKFNDLKGMVNMTIFPRQYAMYKDMIYDNKLIQAKVIRMDDKTDAVSVNSLNDIGAVYASS
jgi:DNA polymerase III alpha subunit